MLIEFNDKRNPLPPFRDGTITCQICGSKENWHCRETVDGTVRLCRNVPSDKTEKYGRYIHLSKDVSPNHGNRIFELGKEPKIEFKANSQTTDDVYTALLENLTLNANHFEDLSAHRQMLEKTITRNRYASVPDESERARVTQFLASNFDLRGVAGFYTEDNVWRFNANARGFFVPYRNADGLIVGMQIRLDNPIKGSIKYVWLSSKNKENGATSGAPLHFVNPELVREYKEIVLTEGALKADAIGDLIGCGVVAMAGVDVVSPEKLQSELMKAFPDLEKVIIAFDADYLTNSNVRKALVEKVQTLLEAGYSVVVRTWTEDSGKGYDDAIRTGISEHYLFNEVFIDFEGQKFLENLLGENSISDLDEYLNSAEFDFPEYETHQQESNLHQGNFIFDELSETPSSNELINREETVSNASKDLKPSRDEALPSELADIPILGMSWGVLSQMEFENPEKVIFGLYRGNVGQMVASTDVGKTTLALNLTLSALAGREFNPLFGRENVAKRILYIDGESTRFEISTDINKMTENFTSEERARLTGNLWVMCDEELDDEPVDLANPNHFQSVRKTALQFRPDLIIVDTFSALVNLDDENSNSEVKKRFLAPMKQIARETNSAVLFLHHIGKYNEGMENQNKAYKGRGASNFGGLSRTVFNLSAAKGRITLSCSKTKGRKFEPVIIELDQESRWFRVLGKAPEEEAKPKGNYEIIVNYVTNLGRNVKREEISKRFQGSKANGRMSEKTITRCLADALKSGDLINPEYSYYCAPNLDNTVNVAETKQDFAENE